MDLTNKFLLILAKVSEQREEARANCVWFAQMIGVLYLVSLAEATPGMQICSAVILASALTACVSNGREVR